MAPIVIPGTKVYKDVKAATKHALHDLQNVAKDAGILEKTCKLSELIKQVRKCKTAAEERALVARESAAMRAEFREQARAAPHAVCRSTGRDGRASRRSAPLASRSFRVV